MEVLATTAKEMRCNNNYCPMNKNCETFSNDEETYELVEKQFDVSEECAEYPFWCEAFTPLR